MPAKTRGRIVDIVIIVVAAALIFNAATHRAPKPVISEFAQQVDLTPLAAVAVQHNGRLKSFDSYARSMVKFVSGPRKINGQPADFSYLDLMFRPTAYQDADVVYVKHKDVRSRIARRLANDPSIDTQRLTRFEQTGLISPGLLQRGAVTQLLDEMRQDLIRTSKYVDAIHSALAVLDPRTLSGNLRVVSPGGDDIRQVWLSPDQLIAGGAPQDSVHGGINRMADIPGLDSKLQEEIVGRFNDLRSAWTVQNASAANTAVAQLADLLPQTNPQMYPSRDKLELESWYVRYKGMVWTWIVYLLAIVPLLMSIIYGWQWARRVGVVLFFIGFALQTTSLGIRWYLAGRIPNANMYEAIWAATWFGGLAALVIEFLVRRTRMKNLFALGAAVCAMVAMMASHFMPVTLSADIEHVMPVLNDLWLYIHTNVIIFSYCLIGMAAVTALLYLRYRIGGGDREYARGGAGELMLAGARPNPMLKARTPSTGQVLDGATMVLMELSFILLWAGLVMGAIWADHSWGRPWGWDPKEVFALNTFIIFAILVHVRLKVRDKGLWTAVLACVGCAVMLFNWIVVNFVITGLHSYA